MGQKCFETSGGGAEKPQHRIVDFRVQEKPTDEAGDPVMITWNNKTHNDDQKPVRSGLERKAPTESQPD